jgi:Fe(3+) dicitrate transport protein
MIKESFSLAFIFFSTIANAQVNVDTVNIKTLPDITIVGKNSKSDYQQMPEIVGTNIYAGKKSSLIVLDNVPGNVVNNTMRQVLAKVPGIHVWESDPSGIQIGVAARGLSPNRSWEFNVRQNGYDIAADPFGYPEAYYNPQLQAVQRIEIVRGQGALQYGPQFGGLLNYILRNGSEINSGFEFETQQTIGSQSLFNSFNAIGANNAKTHYYTFFDHRNGNGWRHNSVYYNNAGFATITFKIKTNLSLTAEIMHSEIRSQQPGGLTDSMFLIDGRNSLRARNWFDIKWTTPALIINHSVKNNLKINTKLFGTIGDRNSVGFLQPIIIKDSINASTLLHNNRQVTLDQYRNIGFETRLLIDYKLGKSKNNFSAGVRLYKGTTNRKADGIGSAGTDYDISVIGNFPRHINFNSQNAACFIENIFRIKERLLLVPGVRLEWIKGSASGRNGYSLNGNEILLQHVARTRSFLLTGIGAEYHISNTTEMYANISQAYRPILFSNLQAPPTTDIIAPDLRDANGYNMDIGYRGKMKNILRFDVSLFKLQYNNRIGSITPNGSTYKYVTNIGSSTSKGFEGLVEFNLLRALKFQKRSDLILFCSYSLISAKYNSDYKDMNIKGKQVENAPPSIFRGGVTAGYDNLSLTFQINNVSSSFSDANNTKIPVKNGTIGLIPSYTVADISLVWKFKNETNLRAGVNNLFDQRYFTRRASGYPGPGILPADGRTFFISVGAKLKSKKMKYSK